MASLGLINRVKYSKGIYTVYYYLGSFAIRVLRLFIKKDSKLIVFSSYGGRKFDDSPKSIYDQMIKDPRFDGFEIVWAFMKPNDFCIERGEIVQTDTISYYKKLLTASCWITNTTMERGLSFKDKKTFYFNSWHGTPIKYLGDDIDENNRTFAVKSKSCPYDVFCSQGHYDAEIFKKCYHIPNHIIKIIGLPRNDELITNARIDRINLIKKNLGIDANKKVILYAPTFRDYAMDEHLNTIMSPPLDFQKWKQLLSKDYLLLFRAHYDVVRILNISFNDFVIDVSAYPSISELMIVSDILISDYSSIFFDYSIMCKPMLCFAYDYDTYNAKRGMYFDIRKELECEDLCTEMKVIEEILNMDFSKRNVITRRFRDKYVEKFGNSTKDSLDIIYKALVVK